MRRNLSLFFVIGLSNWSIHPLYIVESAFWNIPVPENMGDFMQQDFLLIWKMKNDDEAAMDVFVRQYYPQILQYCSYHCADRTWAEDLTQETFERFFRKLADYKYQGKSLNYLYTIARNLCIDESRKKREFAVGDIAGVEMSYENAWSENRNDLNSQLCGSSGADRTDWLDEKLLIEAALKRLPEELMEIVILHYFQELSLRETARVLGIGLPLVKYRLGKAKELLKEFLGEDKTGQKCETSRRTGR